MPLGKEKTAAAIDEDPEIAIGAAPIPVTFASVATVYDRGDEIWVLLGSHRPPIGSSVHGDAVEPVAERWIVLPRGAALMALDQAVDLLQPKRSRSFEVS